MFKTTLMFKTAHGILSALVLTTGVALAQPHVSQVSAASNAHHANVQLASRAGNNDTGSEGHMAWSSRACGPRSALRTSDGG
jgi:hypothetical protein